MAIIITEIVMASLQKFAQGDQYAFWKVYGENQWENDYLTWAAAMALFLLNARNNGWKVTGTEANPHPAQALGLDVRPSIHHIDHNEKFDCITFWHSLEHMEDIKATLFSIARILDTEGHLIIAVPNSDSLQAKIFGPNWLHLDVPRHLYHFNRFSLNFSLEKAGFHIHNTRGNELEYNLIGWSQSAMNCFNLKANLFFHFLTGKVKNCSVWNKAANLILGSILTLLFSAAVFVETFAEHNGTIVITARKNCLHYITNSCWE